jgi:hypothetical protein
MLPKSKLEFYAKRRESVRDRENGNGAGDRDRTGDIQLGKLAFYR